MITYGDCKCHAGHGLTVPADSLDGICATCRARDPSACSRAHERETKTATTTAGTTGDEAA